MSGRVQLDVFGGRHWTPLVVAAKRQLVLFDANHERAADAADLANWLTRLVDGFGEVCHSTHTGNEVDQKSEC